MERQTRKSVHKREVMNNFLHGFTELSPVEVMAKYPSKKEFKALMRNAADTDESLENLIFEVGLSSIAKEYKKVSKTVIGEK